MTTIADRANAAPDLAALDVEAPEPHTLVGSPVGPVLATPGAATFVVGAKVAGAGLAAITAGVAVGEAID
jgi:hypothetical protein